MKPNQSPLPIPAQVRQLELRLPEDVDLHLSPYFVILSSCFHDAWNLWMEMASNVPRQFQMIKARSRANLVYDFICQTIRDKLGDDPDVKFVEKHGLLLMMVKDQFLLRFKKLDQNKLTCKGYTVGHKQYFSQQITLPGMPIEAARLVAGYQLDAAQAAVSDVVITLQWERTLLWFHSIKEVAVELGQKNEAVPGNKDGAVLETPRKPRVKATVIPKIAGGKQAQERKDQDQAHDDSSENAT